jgi:SAM-dependent methyltransferase
MTKSNDFSSRVQALSSSGTFLGGPAQDFERVGRAQLATLVCEGAYPTSRVLDVGCGCLRGGYWMIHFLGPRCYYGIEPSRDMLDAGLEHLLEASVREAKKPVFDHNDQFDFSVFETKFDFVVARSIFTHASKAQISRMLDAFEEARAPGGVFLASYLPAGPFGGRDYRGKSWVGRSHESDQGGIVRHRLSWIRSECASRGLEARELDYGVINNQRWLRVESRRLR